MAAFLFLYGSLFVQRLSRLITDLFSRLMHIPVSFNLLELSMAQITQEVALEGNIGRIGSLNVYEDTHVIDFTLRAPGLKSVPIEGSDETKLEDVNGFWVMVSVWGKDALDIERVLSVGNRVRVTGELGQDEYVSKKAETAGQEKTVLKLRARHVSLALRNIESVKFTAPAAQIEGEDS